MLYSWQLKNFLFYCFVFQTLHGVIDDEENEPAPHIVKHYTPMVGEDVLVLGRDSLRVFNNEPVRRNISIEEKAFAEPSPTASRQQSSKQLPHVTKHPHKAVSSSGEGVQNCSSQNPFHGTINGKMPSTSVPTSSKSFKHSDKEKHASKPTKLNFQNETEDIKSTKSSRKFKSMCSQS